MLWGGTKRGVHRHLLTPGTLLGLLVVLFAASTCSAGEPKGPATSLHVAVRPSPGCASTSSRTGQEVRNFWTAEADGSYIQQVPTSATPGRALPVVFDFHGYQQSGAALVTFSALGAYGESHGFLTILPGSTMSRFPSGGRLSEAGIWLGSADSWPISRRQPAWTRTASSSPAFRTVPS
jgi:S-formylglutathione hydrolase FrmB